MSKSEFASEKYPRLFRNRICASEKSCKAPENPVWVLCFGCNKLYHADCVETNVELLFKETLISVKNIEMTYENSTMKSFKSINELKRNCESRRSYMFFKNKKIAEMKNKSPLSPIKKIHENKIIETNESKKSNELNIHSFITENDFNFKAKLKLDIIAIEPDKVCLKFYKGRSIKCRSNDSPNSFIKVCVIPDDCDYNRFETNVVFGGQQPIFNEKMMLQYLDAEDKRLFITLWHKDTINNRDEFIGCMSFSIKTVIECPKKTVGWFNLLPLSIGKNKHHKINLQNIIPMPIVPRYRIDENDNTVTRIVALRNIYRYGYGFTVKGKFPVKIAKIKKDSPAEHCGMTTNDYIIEIDGINVSRSTADTVTKLIKKTKKVIMLKLNTPIVVDINNPCNSTMLSNCEKMKKFTLDKSELKRKNISPIASPNSSLQEIQNLQKRKKVNPINEEMLPFYKEKSKSFFKRTKSHIFR
ncbi:hypothetical protein A3Q56_04654 [Intoshia linei]|uniref:PDZ domain-containing protein n=1 Tax=Intoshia linei TaxID=1819745 RepID=A0A177AZX1_9BILA|nr:hypothetical protein A3Q56_04654 [Intoshia linei]